MSERSDEATQVFFITTILFVWLGAVVIVKPKMESPITEEPIVFGYARFSGGAKELPGTDFALNIGDEKDRVAKMSGAGDKKGERAKRASLCHF